MFFDTPENPFQWKFQYNRYVPPTNETLLSWEMFSTSQNISRLGRKPT